MANSVVVKGLQQLSRNFNRLSQEVNGQCKKVMRRLVKKVADNAKAAAPVDSGDYRRSIKYSMSKNGLFGWAYAGKKGDSKRGYLGHLLEYGTVKTRAIPHFLPALDKARAAFESEIKSAIAQVKGGSL